MAPRAASGVRRCLTANFREMLMFERFTPRSRQIIHRANAQARRFRQAFVGTECLLLGLLDDGPNVLTDLGIDRRAVREEVRKLVVINSLHKIPRTLTRTPRAQRAIRYAVQEARGLKDRQVKPEHLLLGLLRETKGVAAQVLRRLGLQLDEVRDLVLRMMGGPGELAGSGTATTDESAYPSGSPTDTASAFHHLTTDLTQLAREHRLDPVVGREREIDRLVQVLCKRNKGNVAILGYAGVGKTALVEALAQRAADHRVPPSLQHRPIISLDLVGLVAGTSHRGDVETRLKHIIERCRETQAILFVDEMHMLVKAGDSSGIHDVANLLKPVLSRREIQCIGATTEGEFERSIGKNPALLRRFERFTVLPPDALATRAILTAMRPRLETHHSVRISGKAIRQAVKLSDQYLRRRVQPDKALDVLDEAAARVRMQTAPDTACAPPVVDEQAVACVVAAITGLPVAEIRDQKRRWLNLEASLAQDVVGQNGAISRIARVIRRARSGLGDRHRPVGSFLLAGPGGTGKTRLAQAVAQHVFANRLALVHFDLAGFIESHQAAQLLGAAPGYVGHEEPGQLTEAVRRHPGSVVLLEHVDLAHQAIQSLLLQIMDHGQLTDGSGRIADFSQTILLATVDTSALTGASHFGFGDSQTWHNDSIKTAIENLLPPEFVNRLDDILLMPPLDTNALARLIEMELARLAERLEPRNLGLSLTAEAHQWLLDQATGADQGARGVQRVIDQFIRDPLSDALLAGRIPTGVTLRIERAEDAVRFTCAPCIESDAHIPA